jgi:thioredoxin reductase/bacterioferritin-associated ferredoxin
MIADLADGFDVVILGAGPAGLSAAATAAEAGLSTLVVDENATPGGQVYRSVEVSPVADHSVLGPEYWQGADLVARARASGAVFAHGTTVWCLDSRLQVGIAAAGAARMLDARAVIIATGALERPFPIPGWTLPGVLTIGAAQTLLKASGLVPQGRVVLAGMGPLLWLYAAQMLRAGGGIEAILDTTPRESYARALRHLPGFLCSSLALKGLALLREVKSQVHVIPHVSALAAQGNGKLARVRYTARGGQGEFAVDTLLLHQGVVPHVNLAMAAGVKHGWNETQCCWHPVLDADGESSVPGIFIAGDGAGIAGAAAAEARGAIAGHAVIRRLNPAAAPDDKAARAALGRAMRGRLFLDALYQPPRPFRVPTGETIVCRCEEVTAAEVRRTAADLGCEGPNQLKAFLRTGMGPCQGRLCSLTVTELIAEARGTTPAEVGHFRIRPPVKPITLGELATLPADAAAEKAVVRL